jgi:GGDEF domain-containing protein
VNASAVTRSKLKDGRAMTAAYTSVFVAQPFLISASIGIAVCPVGAISPDSLLKKADLGLHHAKNAGRNRYHYYTEALDEVAHRKNADHDGIGC